MTFTASAKDGFHRKKCGCETRRRTQRLGCELPTANVCSAWGFVLEGIWGIALVSFSQAEKLRKSSVILAPGTTDSGCAIIPLPIIDMERSGVVVPRVQERYIGKERSWVCHSAATNDDAARLGHI